MEEEEETFASLSSSLCFINLSTLPEELTKATHTASDAHKAQYYGKLIRCPCSSHFLPQSPHKSLA
eukprot:245976-Amphidinium_carterae.1